MIGRLGLNTPTARARVSRGLLLAASAGSVLVASFAAGSGPLITSRRLVPQTVPLQHPAPSVFPTLSPSVAPAGDALAGHAGAATAGATAGARVAIVIAAVIAGIALASFLFFAVRALIRIISDLDTLPLGERLEATATLPEAVPEHMQRKLGGQMALALEDLEKGDDPRRAIMACWLRLEAAAATGGVERLPSETSSELVRKVLDRLHVATTALDRLHDLYLRARFSAAPVAVVDRDAARAALERLRLGVVLGPGRAEGPSGEIR